MDEFERKCVLLVEDNNRLRATVGELLRWQGYRVNEAADGAEAFTAAVAMQPDVILTDLNMPVMDGETFIQRCRRTPGLDNVPIVVMSGQEESDVTPERLRAARVSAYLVKPFGVEELSTAVECSFRLLDEIPQGSNRIATRVVAGTPHVAGARIRSCDNFRTQSHF